MESLVDIFRAFCKFVDERIFQENAGSYVAFVIDQAFIDEFCKINSIQESFLMSAVRRSLYSYRRDSLYVKGIIAIQLFAASKRANDRYITEKNYRDRLSQVLNWDMNDLQSWMSDYQDEVWSTLYRWCDNNYFQISKCERRSGPYCYVQYPVNQALRVFTDEDLKYIAYCFVDNHLSPGEDLQKRDFRKIISKSDIIYSINTNHGRLVVENSINDEDYYSQVYNYFLRWNGEYKERYGKAHISKNNEADKSFLYIPDDLSCLELRKGDLSLKQRFDIQSTSYQTLAKCYNFKRRGLILFKHDDVYENYWQEIRYLEGKEEEGLLISYLQIDSVMHYRLRPFMVYQNKYVQIFKIKYGSTTSDLYTDKRFYELYGGLKIGRQTYLYGAAPILRLERYTRIWIDGKAYGDDECKGDISLNHLSLGNHYIKIQNFKKIEFELQAPTIGFNQWMNDYNKWVLNKKESQWDSCISDDGIVGLDYSPISSIVPISISPTLKRWADFLTFGKTIDNETNVTINILKRQVYD